MNFINKVTTRISSLNNTDCIYIDLIGQLLSKEEIDHSQEQWVKPFLGKDQPISLLDFSIELQEAFKTLKIINNKNIFLKITKGSESKTFHINLCLLTPIKT